MKTARVIIDKDYSIGEVDKRLFGAFVEHLGRVIYGGLYQPDSPFANEKGYREDVLKMVRQIGVPVVRYPGGNYVSGLDWEDTIGLQREARPNMAWACIEPNTFGLHEFCDWAREAGAEVMYTVNLGTRTPKDAGNLLEYANIPSGTKYSDMRISNGAREPLNIKLWCLGNEMDGCWQMGQKTGHEYGVVAREAAKIMRRLDSSIELVACGSSSSWMDTVGQWELDVLSECYNEVDYISLHRYYEQKFADTPSYLADVIDMEKYIQTIIAACDVTKGIKRSEKTMYLSFDEWNVGYHAREKDAKLRKGPKWPMVLPLLEDEYNFEDALFVGSMLISLLRHADRIKIACIAQLVNALAPIMTSDKACWAQTIFYPYLHASSYGRGTSIACQIACDCYSTAEYTAVPYMDAAAVCHEDGGLTIFCINRSLNEDIDAVFDLRSFCELELNEHIVYHHDDVLASNTEAEPDRVVPGSKPVSVFQNNQGVVKLPALSWNVLRFMKKG